MVETYWIVPLGEFVNVVKDNWMAPELMHTDESVHSGDVYAGNYRQ